MSTAPSARHPHRLFTSLPRTNTMRTRLQAKEAEAVTIVGFGNSKNKWNGYAEVELCTSESPVEEAPEVEIEGTETTTESEAEAETGTESEAEAETGTESEAESTVEFTELPFPTGRKGFNVVNLWVQCFTLPFFRTQ